MRVVKRSGRGRVLMDVHLKNTERPFEKVVCFANVGVAVVLKCVLL